MLASHGISRLSSFEDWSKGWLDYASARKQLFVEGLRAGKLHQPSTHSDQKVAMLECLRRQRGCWSANQCAESTLVLSCAKGLRWIRRSWPNIGSPCHSVLCLLCYKNNWCILPQNKSGRELIKFSNFRVVDTAKGCERRLAYLCVILSLSKLLLSNQNFLVCATCASCTRRKAWVALSEREQAYNFLIFLYIFVL
jgi:hypothetical protein